VEVVVIQFIKRLLVVWARPKPVRHHAVGWSMQFRELSCGCKALLLGNGKKLWIVGLTERSYESCHERSLS
jgi:hypothetical protein